jgi:hypothetical protein
VLYLKVKYIYLSDFWSFGAIYVQRPSVFFLRIPLLDTTCDGSYENINEPSNALNGGEFFGWETIRFSKRTQGHEVRTFK